ncbi:unnamed protein product [Ceratitis capitata]|uniref:(Mediterranean fruit fly) hypothetical protein n=1 Tax=Ceratitis capitata TaxID=7213 RepID=A0A811TZ61_CERCA|nr:unnamed protein product [Ceratitis capitata]
MSNGCCRRRRLAVLVDDDKGVIELTALSLQAQSVRSKYFYADLTLSTALDWFMAYGCWFWSGRAPRGTKRSN